MERKTVNYEVKYFKKGVDLVKHVEIKRISRGTMKEYGELMTYALKSTALLKEKENKTKEIAWVLSDTKIRYWDRISKAKPLGKELIEIEKKINEYADIFPKAVEIVASVLDENGIEDKDLIKFSFWNKCTDDTEIWDFLNTVIYKDVDTSAKKKLNTI